MSQETYPCVMRSASLGFYNHGIRVFFLAHLVLLDQGASSDPEPNDRKDGLVREAMWRCFGKAGDEQNSDVPEDVGIPQNCQFKNFNAENDDKP